MRKLHTDTDTQIQILLGSGCAGSGCCNELALLLPLGATNEDFVNKPQVVAAPSSPAPSPGSCIYEILSPAAAHKSWRSLRVLSMQLLKWFVLVNPLLTPASLIIGQGQEGRGVGSGGVLNLETRANVARRALERIGGYR